MRSIFSLRYYMGFCQNIYMGFSSEKYVQKDFYDSLQKNNKAQVS